ncbi:MAG: alkene reductase [Candidatus Obscuribacterales bacterium]|nr:alkene reductase [Candidatus Obscuribacterales bacterium]
MPTIVPNLLKPIKIGNHNLKNRVVMAPMTRARAGIERIPNDAMAEYYAQRSGAGLIISEGTNISPSAIGWINTPGIWSDEQTKAWRKITDAVHLAGSLIFVQLWHCGRASHSSFHNDVLSVAPSAIGINESYIHTPLGKKPHEVPRALESHEIPKIVADYAKAAQNAKLAGFDGAEIHSANGYLLDTFLQSKTNKRKDEYGSSAENRFRFLRNVVEEVSKVFSSANVGVKIAPNTNYNDTGSPDFRETFLYVASELSRYNLAYLHVVDGITFGFHGLGEPMRLNEFREVFSGALIGNCGYTKEAAELAIRDGRADMISFGRPFISNPDLVERFENDHPLNDGANPKLWYSFDTVGYTDFPRYDELISKATVKQMPE